MLFRSAYIIGGFDCASAHGSKVIGRGVIAPGHLYSRDFIFEIGRASCRERV